MKIDLEFMLSAVKLVGAATPAFKALFDRVVDTFDGDDQAQLKRRYAEEVARSNATKDRVDEALR